MVMSKAHMLRGKGSAAQKRDLLERRIRLAKQIVSFERAMAELVQGEWQDYHLLSNPSEDDSEIDEEWEDTSSDCGEDDDDIGEMPLEWESSERTVIRMPSRLNVDMLKSNGLAALIDQEVDLREGQMNEALCFLRSSQGDKAFIYHYRMRGRQSNRVKGAGRKDVAARNKDVTRQVRTFMRCKAALIRLGSDVSSWPDITEADLRLSGDITEPNRLGQNKDTLPWFWRLEEGGESEGKSSERMEECKSFI
jgi:hypothetical protein